MKFAFSKTFTLIILTRNRPDYLIKCVNSTKDILGEILISDNSTQDYNYEFSVDNYKIIKRSGNLSALEHFNICSSEITTKYFAIFHDDDLFIAENYLSYIEFVHSNNIKNAACANAYLINHDDNRNLKNKMVSYQKNTLFTSHDIYNFYINPTSISLPPFPVYIYAKNSKIKLEEKLGGKFSDAALIHNLSIKSPITYYSKPVMKYRLHSNNDQKSFIIKNYKLLFLYFKHYYNNNLLLTLWRIRRFTLKRKKNHAINISLLAKVYFLMSLYFYFRLVHKLKKIIF